MQPCRFPLGLSLRHRLNLRLLRARPDLLDEIFDVPDELLRLLHRGEMSTLFVLAMPDQVSCLCHAKSAQPALLLDIDLHVE